MTRLKCDSWTVADILSLWNRLWEEMGKYDRVSLSGADPGIFNMVRCKHFLKRIKGHPLKSAWAAPVYMIAHTSFFGSLQGHNQSDGVGGGRVESLSHMASSFLEPSPTPWNGTSFRGLWRAPHFEKWSHPWIFGAGVPGPTVRNMSNYPKPSSLWMKWYLKLLITGFNT